MELHNKGNDNEPRVILKNILHPTLSLYPAHAWYSEIHFTIFEAQQLVASFPNAEYNRDQVNRAHKPHLSFTERILNCA